MTSCLRRVLPLVLGAALSTSALAIQPHAPEGLAPDASRRLGGVPFVLPEVNAEASKQWADGNAAFRAFVAEAGAPWIARWDRRTDRLSFAHGTFPAWLDAGARVRNESERLATRDFLDAQCRDLMSRHAALFRLPAGAELVLDPARSVDLDAGRVWQVSYAVFVGDVRVEGAAVFFRINSGRLIQAGQELVGDSLALVPKEPHVAAADAQSRARADVASLFAAGVKAETLEEAAAPRLAVLPWSDAPRSYAGEPGVGLQYRLAWRTAFRVPGRIETWTAWHDALTGDRLALFDDNDYACPPPAQPMGRVVGGVYVGPIEEVPEVLRGFPYTLVDHGTPLVTDVNGVFPFTPGTSASTSMSGGFFDMNCFQCANPAQAFASTSGWGYLSLGVGGDNTTGNGFSSKAERNCFYHLNIVRQIADKHLDDANTSGFLSRLTPANVNIPATCNAFWDGNSVNFFIGGGGCNNTGEIADVMQHEWGHGLDQFTGGGADGARGESIGDVVGFMSTHDARLGPYFVQGDGAGIRNADENVTGLMTRSNVGTFCPSVGGGGDGPLGFQVHCESGISTQAWWHLTRNLRQKMVNAGGGEQAGWYVAEKLFFQSLPLSRTYLPEGPQSTYDAIAAVDDDNGNLLDGTPNAAEYNDAFTHHEIAPATLMMDTADCAPPAAPVVTLSSAQHPGTGLWQVRVTWTAVPGAAEYSVLRNAADGRGADEELALVLAPATEYFDDDVTDGVTYRYRVTARLPNGCTSIVDNQQQVTVAALANVALQSWSFDDTGNPGANANGVAEPGETLVIPVTAINSGSGPATAVLAELTTTAPGVTIVRGSQNLGDMPVGAARSTASPHFAVQLDRTQVACGQVIPFSVSFQATEGCATSGFSLQVGDPPAPCEAPEPRPRLRHAATVLGDDASFGGDGDNNGFADPGETVRIPVQIENVGNDAATNVRGTLVGVSLPPGVTISDADTTWPGFAPGETHVSDGAPAHVEITLDQTTACGAVISLRLDVAYDGPAGSYVLSHAFDVLVGRIVEPAVFADDFETSDNGFTHGASCTNPGCDDWQRSQPTNASAFDPTVAHSGTTVWGNDLGTLVAQGSNGEYRRDTTSWLDSPPIDCTGLTGTKLSYWRWLSVEAGEFDHARVRISTDGTNWTTIWENPFAGDLLDTQWTYMEHDISALADGQSSVRVRFELESDGGLQYGGWTLDDFRVFTRATECTGGCATGAPGPVGPALRATGRKSETSAEFEWSSAAALAPGETWKVYRGTVASDVTTVISPIDLATAQLEDTSAPDRLYFYRVVRTNCLGIDGPTD